MRVFASVLAFSAVIAAGAAYAQAPAAAPRTDDPPRRRRRQGRSQRHPRRQGRSQRHRHRPPPPGVEAPFPGRDEVRLRQRAGGGGGIGGRQGGCREDQGPAGAEVARAAGEEQGAAERPAEARTGWQRVERSARAQLQAEIERQQRDLQRFTEDAQQDVQQLAEQVEGEFNRKLTPIIDRVAKQKGVHFVFNAAQSGLIWAEPGMDLTAEVIQAFDSPAAAAPAPAPAPAAAPAAPK